MVFDRPQFSSHISLILNRYAKFWIFEIRTKSAYNGKIIGLSKNLTFLETFEGRIWSRKTNFMGPGIFGNHEWYKSSSR